MKQRLMSLFAVSFLLVSCGESLSIPITLEIDEVSKTKLALYQQAN